MATKPDTTPTPARGASTAMERVRDMLATMSDVAPQSAEELQAQILERYLNATTPAELLAEGATVSAEEVLGENLTIKEVKFNQSTTKNGPPIYAVIDATIGDRDVVITCGSLNVMTQVYKAKESGWLPMSDVCITQLPVPTAQGFYPMYLSAWVEGGLNKPRRAAPAKVNTTINTTDPDEEAF